MDIETAERTIKECEELKTRIESARRAMESDQEGAERRLTDLRRELPTTLASLALGEVTQGEVAEVKGEMSELQDSISDMGLTLEGLDLRESEVNKELKKARKVIDRHEAELRYEDLKKRLQVQYSVLDDGNLRQAAQAISAAKANEADDFLRELKKKLGQAPHGRNVSTMLQHC